MSESWSTTMDAKPQLEPQLETDRQKLEGSWKTQESLDQFKAQLEKLITQNPESTNIMSEALSSSEKILTTEQIVERLSSEEPIDMTEMLDTIMRVENRTNLTEALNTLSTGPNIRAITENEKRVKKAIEIEAQIGPITYGGKWTPATNQKLIAIPIRIEGRDSAGYALEGSKLILPEFSQDEIGNISTKANNHTDVPYFINEGKVYELYYSSSVSGSVRANPSKNCKMVGMGNTRISYNGIPGSQGR